MSKTKSPCKELSRCELIKLVNMQAETIRRLQKRVEELVTKLSQKNPTERLDDEYSLKSEEQRKQAAEEKKTGRKNKTATGARKGRVTTADKVKNAEQTETIYPEAIEQAECKFSHTRVAWRLENGRAVLVAYDIHRHRNDFGRIPGVLGKSEFGIEIILALAYQVYCLGLSIDKAIKLTLTSPNEPRYRALADGLLAIYRDAKRISPDGRMLESTKQSKVPELDDRVLQLCGGRWIDEDRDCSGDEDDYRPSYRAHQQDAFGCEAS